MNVMFEVVQVMERPDGLTRLDGRALADIHVSDRLTLIQASVADIQSGQNVRARGALSVRSIETYRREVETLYAGLTGTLVVHFEGGLPPAAGETRGVFLVGVQTR